MGGGVLPLSIGAVGVFYSPSWLGILYMNFKTFAKNKKRHVEYIKKIK